MDIGWIVGISAVIIILTVPTLLAKLKPEWICTEAYLEELKTGKK